MISKPVHSSWHPKQQIAYVCDTVFAETHWLFILYSAFLKKKKLKGKNEITLNHQERQILSLEIFYRNLNVEVRIKTIYT